MGMPDKYRCQACRGIMWHANQTLWSIAPPPGSARKWKSFEIEDAMAGQVCVQSNFEGYGVRLGADGENALGGPGLKEEEVSLEGGGASIQMGSETWKKRMAEESRKLIVGGEELFGEEEEDGPGALYKLWKEGGLQARDGASKVCGRANFCSVDKKKEKKRAEKASAEERRKAKEVKRTERKARKEKERLAKAAQSAVKKVSAETFLTGLAREHGKAADAYTTPRTTEEWANTLKKALETAGRDEL